MAAVSYNLSYIIATRNRLPFLKITLAKLLSGLQPDEEVVVVDGNSTDGTREFLQELFEKGKIHQFISEPDKNQAHGWNKAMLMAKGVVIKKIIDDDVFCYEAISKCKTFMMQHPQVDVVISNDLASSLSEYKKIWKLSRLPQFNKWSNGIVPSFTFGDVHLLIRKSALAYIGLYNTSFVMMDWEYSLRISYLHANIAYYTGYNALSVSHPQTVSSAKNDKLIEQQGKRGGIFYEYSGDLADISTWSKIKIGAGKLIKPGKTEKVDKTNVPTGQNYAEEIETVYNFYYDQLREVNESEDSFFVNKMVK